MGIYAALGVSLALGFFFMGLIFALITYYASRNLHQGALNRVMHAPMSFFETTPLGRILNRFAKGIQFRGAAFVTLLKTLFSRH